MLPGWIMWAKGGGCGGQGAAELEAELQEQNWSELEIPRRSSPLTYLLLSPPNLLTFGKGESSPFACFSNFPTPLGLSQLLTAQSRAQTGREEEGEPFPSPPQQEESVSVSPRQCPVAPSDANAASVMVMGPEPPSTGLTGDPAELLKLPAVGGGPDSFLLTGRN